MRILVCIFCSLLITFNLLAQELKYGAKAGLNMSNIVGPSETDDVTGADLEGSSYIVGFHIGPTLNYKFSEKSSFVAEMMFSQKGGKYRFDDASSYLFLMEPEKDSLLTKDVYVEGSKKQILVNNIGYVDLSAMYFFNPVSNLKIGIGATAGFMLNSSGIGETTFSGKYQEGSSLLELDQIIVRHNNRYLRDTITTYPVKFTQIRPSEVTVNENSLLDKLFFPAETTGYYDYSEKNGAFFNRFDLGANVEVRWETDSGLYLGLRGNFGLLDVTNNFYDFSKGTLDENLEYIPRSDVDRSISIQASVGFNF